MLINQTLPDTAHLLRGRIRNLRKIRCRRDFMFTSDDRTKMGATAVVASLAGLGGVATGLGAMAIDTTEEAELLEFELDGVMVRAWVWMSVFNEGDEVEVVAEPDGNAWLGYSVRRVSDRIVALYPHCSRGRNAHYKVSVAWFLKLTGCIVLAAYLLMAAISFFSGDSFREFASFALAMVPAMLISSTILGVIAYRISRKYLGFVRLAERVFHVFGWSDVKNIDLPAITKMSKKPDDPGALGILFFRY